MATLRRVSKFQRGQSWYLDYYDETGHRRQPSKGPISEPEAESHRQNLELALNGRTATITKKQFIVALREELKRELVATTGWKPDEVMTAFERAATTALLRFVSMD